MQSVVLSSPGTKQQRKPGGASSKEAYKRDVAGYLSSVKGTWQRDPSQRLDHSTIPGSDIFVRLGRLSRSNVRGGPVLSEIQVYDCLHGAPSRVY